MVIGVHTPEFAFEKETKNVAMAIKQFGITYPVAQDNDYQTWKSFRNQYWPAKYLFDSNGVIRETHFGEGEYDRTEKMIQTLLKESGAKGVPSDEVQASYEIYSNTAETYLGFNRLGEMANVDQVVRGIDSVYTPPKILASNQFSLGGRWKLEGEFSTPRKGATLEFNFDAKEVFLVMKNNGQVARVKVLLDGTKQMLGSDVIDGTVTIDQDRLYKLIKLDTPGKHTLKLIFEDGNAELFAFTFG